MKEYYLSDDNKVIVDGNIKYINGKPFKCDIGFNYINGVKYGRNLSSFDGIFTDEKIIIENGLADLYETSIGDVDDAYDLLDKKISELNPKNFNDICEIVLLTVDEYFGGLTNYKSRLDCYYSGDYEESKNNKISNLKGKGAGMCVERAALSQNLLKHLNINSIYKSSGIVLNGRKECHSYNLVEYDGKYYLFDSTMPNMVKDRINPLIAQIDKESFDLITCPLAEYGCSISVSHYNPYQNKNYDVIYDSARNKTISVEPYICEEEIKHM